jgi:CRP/FNR family transcriptional regulator, cyclic AMP receptor protein
MGIQPELLALSPCCRGFDKKTIEEVAARFSSKTAGAGEMLSLEGERSDVLYLVAAGTARLLKTSADGKEQTLEIIRPVTSFNEIAVLDGLPNPYSTEAIDPVTLYGIRRDDLLNLAKTYPRINRNLIAIITARVRHLASLVEDLSFRTVSARVAKILLEYATADSTERKRLTQREMAAMAGTAREVVGRALKFLEDSGAIRFDRHRLIISNKDKLTDIAGITAT